MEPPEHLAGRGDRQRLVISIPTKFRGLLHIFLFPVSQEKKNIGSKNRYDRKEKRFMESGV